MKISGLIPLLLCLVSCGPSESTVSGQGTQTTTASAGSTELTCEQIERERRNFLVEVLELDESRYGQPPAYAYYTRLRITNNSSVTLPALTALFTQYDASGQRIGSSRKPSIPASSIAPGDTVEVEHYPAGWMPQRATVEARVEDVIGPEVREFFEELEGCQ